MERLSEEKKSLDDNSKKALEKKTYTTPTFLDYGNVAKLTQSGTGTGADGGTVSNMMMVCL